MTAKYLIDTSAWIEYLEATPIGQQVQRIVAREGACAHPLVIAETIAVAARRGKSTEDAYLSFRELALLPCWNSPADWRDAGLFYAERRRSEPTFPLADAILYTAAQKAGLVLVTKDNHFRGLKGVRMVGEKG